MEDLLTTNLLDSTMSYKRRGIMAFSIRLSEEEKKLADSYAKLHNLSLGEAFKSALFEKIEEEYDIVIAEEAYKKYVQEGKKSRPVEKLWEDLDI